MKRLREKNQFVNRPITTDTIMPRASAQSAQSALDNNLAGNSKISKDSETRLRKQVSFSKQHDSTSTRNSSADRIVDLR